MSGPFWSCRVAALPKKLVGLRPNLRWPAKPGNCLVPWYVILWRSIWWIPIMLGIGLTTVFIACALGVDSAEEFWERAR